MNMSGIVGFNCLITSDSMHQAACVLAAKKWRFTSTTSFIVWKNLIRQPQHHQLTALSCVLHLPDAALSPAFRHVASGLAARP
jgi:hypothetical protein